MVTGGSLVATWLSFDCLAAGCLLALRPRDVDRYLAWADAHGRELAAIAGTVLLADLTLAWLAAGAAQSHSAIVRLVLVASAEAAIVALGIGWCVRHPESVVGRVLNSRGARVIGIGSYSVYLWQELFFSPDHLAALTLPGALVVTGAVAALSYFGVERPALALRRRLEARRLEVTSSPPHAIFNG